MQTAAPSWWFDLVIPYQDPVSFQTPDLIFSDAALPAVEPSPLAASPSAEPASFRFNTLKRKRGVFTVFFTLFYGLFSGMKRALPRLLLFPLGLILAGSPRVFAQLIPTVRIDPHSRFGQQVAPFDHRFYLLLPVDSNLQKDELDTLILNKLIVRKKKVTDDTAIWKVSLRSPDKIQFVDTPKEAGFKYLKVLMDVQLLPNTRFSITLSTKPSFRFGDDLNSINESLYRGDAGKAEKDYEDIRKNLADKYSKMRIL